MGNDSTQIFRPRQANAFSFSISELEKALNIPQDHRIVRIELNDSQFLPGIIIQVEGPCCQIVPIGAPVGIDYYYNKWLEHINVNRLYVLNKYGPYEW
jgi:hypothetical protein